MLEEETHRLPRPKRRAILLEEEAHRLARRLAADRDGNPTALVRRLIREEAQRDARKSPWWKIRPWGDSGPDPATIAARTSDRRRVFALGVDGWRRAMFWVIGDGGEWLWESDGAAIRPGQAMHYFEMPPVEGAADEVAKALGVTS